MRNPKTDYIIRYWFEWKAGCFWSANNATRERFGYLIPPEELPLSELTIKRANELVDWHDQALNWEYPPDPGPWRQDECERFNQAAKDLDAIQVQRGRESKKRRKIDGNASR